jgi:hypothetical protein
MRNFGETCSSLIKQRQRKKTQEQEEQAEEQPE